MRDALERESLSQLGPLVYPLDDATVVQTEELPQDQYGKQLRLSELVGALWV